ncbi:hypothetical protein [Streptomyces sp. NPDC048411]
MRHKPIQPMAERLPEGNMRTLLLIGSSQTRAVERGGGRTITWTPRRYG